MCITVKAKPTACTHGRSLVKKQCSDIHHFDPCFPAGLQEDEQGFEERTDRNLEEQVWHRRREGQVVGSIYIRMYLTSFTQSLSWTPNILIAHPILMCIIIIVHNFYLNPCFAMVIQI